MSTDAGDFDLSGYVRSPHRQRELRALIEQYVNQETASLRRDLGDWLTRAHRQRQALEEIAYWTKHGEYADRAYRLAREALAPPDEAPTEPAEVPPATGERTAHTTAPWHWQPAAPIAVPGFAYQVSAAQGTPWPVALTVTPADAQLVAAAPDLLHICQILLARLDLEGEQLGPGATFLGAAYREDLRRIITQAIGEEAHP